MTRFYNLTDALAAEDARILVHEAVSVDRNGNSRSRQSVYAINGDCLYSDGRTRSYWYKTENQRRAFQARGGLVLSP